MGKSPGYQGVPRGRNDSIQEPGWEAAPVRKILKILIAVSLFCAFVAVLTGAILWYVWSSNLPYIGSLRNYNPPLITEIYSDNGEVIGRFWDEKRIVVSLDQLPKHLIQAFIAAEDSRFYQHEGVDFLSIIRAFIKNTLAGRIEQGASTITQQVAKSLLLKDTGKSYRRKVREATLSLQIEKEFSKQKILFLYLNQIYLGQGAYGVEAAARTYFGKSASELNLAESAMLAGLTQAPSKYSIISHFEKAKARQQYVLQRMKEEGYITQHQEEEAAAAEIKLNVSPENTFEKAPYFTEYVRQYIEQKYGRDLLYRGGLKVYTTLNLDMQRQARAAIKQGLLELDKREGYRGPLKHLEPAEREFFKREWAIKYASEPPKVGDVVHGLIERIDDQKNEVVVAIGERLAVLPLSEMRWARKPDPDVPSYAALLKSVGGVFQVGDVVLVRIKEPMPKPYDWMVSLEQKPEVQGALFCMEPGTGRVKAMVGGRDFSLSQFNRAIQARRQPGSSFKPIIYAAALDQGMTPSTIILDAPYLSSTNPEDEIWKPKNFKETFTGPTLFRQALIQSRNVITVKILKQIGVPYVISYARKMGIEADLAPDLSLALGSSGLSLEELCRAYAVFANGGMLADPIFVDRIEDWRDGVLESNQPSLKQAISKETAFVMTDLLEAVIQEGTGWRSKALKRPAAGKTGTTNDLRDAWFVGYTPSLVAGVWVGYDDRRSMGQNETGSRAANPIWLYFMSEALKDRPVEAFQVPEGVTLVKIDTKTGLLASHYSTTTTLQAFKAGREPTEFSPEPESPKTGQFSQFDMQSDD
jgi:penicillin-binding protein 1A